jgi:hypothetical protein
MNNTWNDTHSCDRCGRPLMGKGYLIVNGWNICGVCQFELQMQNTRKDYPDHTPDIPYPFSHIY